MNARDIAKSLKKTLDENEYREGWWEDFNQVPREFLPHAIWLVSRELLYLNKVEEIETEEDIEELDEQTEPVDTD